MSQYPKYPQYSYSETSGSASAYQDEQAQAQYYAQAQYNAQVQQGGYPGPQPPFSPPPTSDLPSYSRYAPSDSKQYQPLDVPPEKASYRQPSPGPSPAGYSTPPYGRPGLQSDYPQDGGYARFAPGSSSAYPPPPGPPPGRMENYQSYGNSGPSSSSGGYAARPGGASSNFARPSASSGYPSSVSGSSFDRQSGAAPASGMSGAMSKASSLVKKFAPGESVEALVNPPPPGFLRDVPPDLPYPPFAPTALVGLKPKLDAGFPAVSPPSREYPHPFVTHDVTLDDWLRFVGDLKKAAGLAPMDRVVSNVIPMVLGMGLVSGTLMSMGMEKRMGKKKKGPVGDLIDQWNYNFFNPRGVQITLAQGTVSYSGFSDGPPPDIQAGFGYDYPDNSDYSRGRGHGGRSRNRSRSSSSSSSGSRHKHRREKRRHRRDDKDGKDEVWRLVVSSVAPGYKAAGF